MLRPSSFHLRFLTDSGQNVLGSSVFEAFGATVGATGSTAGARFGFVGGADCQTEADTGLVLMGHRYYDTRIGRFLSPDPAGDGDNWYAYVGNDPVNKTDPTGMSAINAYSAPDGRNQGPLGGNSGSLMDFFAREDELNQLGQAQAAERSQSSGLQLASDKGNKKYGQISNASSKPIVVEFDKEINGKDTLWKITLEHGFQTTPAVDVDFVMLPSWQGGYWAHLIPTLSYSVVDLPNGLQCVQPAFFRPDTPGNGPWPPTSGYSYHTMAPFASSTAGAWSRGYVRPIAPTAPFGLPFYSPY